MKLTLTLILSFILSFNLSNISEILKEVESNGDIEAIGDSGLAYGVLQIHKGVIEDVNRYYGTDYLHDDAFIEVCAEEIFNLYLAIGINLYVKKHGKVPSTEDVVRMWNGGIYRGYRKESTEKYYKKYKEVINALEN